MSAIGPRIIAGLKEAIAGNFAAATIEGQRWVRADSQLISDVTDLGEAIKRADAENAMLRAALQEISDFPHIGDAARLRLQDIAREALANVKE